MIKISAVIITRNEERNIGRCLESLENVADEIIVVDSFSTDHTGEICGRHPKVRFVQRDWTNYSDQKNYGVGLAGNRYILSLDADEYLSPRLADSILSVKNEAVNYDAYSFNILNIYCGKKIRHGSWYPGRKVRLWNIEKGGWNGSLVHEQIELAKGATVRHLKGDLLHNSHASIAEHVQKINRYTDIGADVALQKGKDVGFFKIFFAFVWRFFRDYFIKLGMLDGTYGLIVCALNSYESFLKYSKLYQKKRQGEC